MVSFVLLRSSLCIFMIAKQRKKPSLKAHLKVGEAGALGFPRYTLLEITSFNCDLCNQARPYGALLEKTPHPLLVLCLPFDCRKSVASWAFPDFQRVNIIREVKKM